MWIDGVWFFEAETCDVALRKKLSVNAVSKQIIILPQNGYWRVPKHCYISLFGFLLSLSHSTSMSVFVIDIFSWAFRLSVWIVDQTLLSLAPYQRAENETMYLNDFERKYKS